MRREAVIFEAFQSAVRMRLWPEYARSFRCVILEDEWTRAAELSCIISAALITCAPSVADHEQSHSRIVLQLHRKSSRSVSNVRCE